MRIRKIEQGTVPSTSRVFTEFNESKMDTYSCNTINTMLNSIESNDPLPIGTILDFDGDEIPEGYGLVDEQEDIVSNQINIMTVKNVGKQIFPAETYTKIILTDPSKVGDKLIAYEGGIKIGAGVSKVKISGYATVMSSAVGGCHLRIIKNMIDTENTVGWLIDRIDAAAGQISMAYPPTLVDVSEGEEYYIYMYTPGTGQVGPDAGTMPQASLTIEVVE